MACIVPMQTPFRKANFTRWVSQNDNDDNRRHNKRLKKKKKNASRGRNGTWVPRITKLTYIQMRLSDAVEIFWILDFDFDYACMGESLAFYPSFS